MAVLAVMQWINNDSINQERSYAVPTVQLLAVRNGVCEKSQPTNNCVICTGNSWSFHQRQSELIFVQQRYSIGIPNCYRVRSLLSELYS